MTHKGQRSGLPYVLQRVAVCRSVSQHVAACCSMLQKYQEVWILFALKALDMSYHTKSLVTCHITHRNESCHTQE